MRRILSAAGMAGAIALGGGAWAENYYGSQFDAPGGTESHFGSGMNQPMVVDVATGTLRERPNVQAKILTTLGRGERVTVIGTANGGGWAHVRVNGLDGYMDFAQLDKLPPQYAAYPPGHPMYVSVDQSELRAQPDIQSQLLAVLPRGTRVTVIDTNNPTGWAHVVANGGLDGYMGLGQLAEASAVQPYGRTYNSTPYPASYQPAYPAGYQPAYQAPYQPTEMVVNGEGGTVHDGPDQQSPLVAVLPPGSRVSVIGSANGGWAHVVVNGSDGYMSFTELQ